MKKKLFLLPIALISSQVFADTKTYPNHSFGLYMRSDLVKQSGDGADDTLKFKSNYLRLNFKGDLTEKTSYRVRFRLDKTLDSSGNIDGTGAGVNYAYLDYKLNDNLKFRVGKQYFAGACGREGDYSGADVYRYSLTCNQNPFYRTGVSLQPKFGDQNLVLSVVNPGNEASQNDLGYSATWYGDLMGGTIKPIVSYIAMPSTETNNTNKYLATGVQYNGANLNVDLDYMTANLENQGASGADKDYKTIALNGRILKNSKIQPIFKFEKSKLDSGGNTGMDRKAYTLGVEYFPNKGGNGVNWRTHAVFTSAEDSFDDGRDNVKDDKFLIGFSLAFTKG